jgi:hypothetical protein
MCALLCIAACRGEARRTGDAAIPDRVASAIPQIEKAVGVKFKTPPKWELRTRDQVRAFLVAQLDDSSAQRELVGKEAAYKVFGLIPDTMSVRRLLVDLLTEQILGYYDPKTKVLYVVRGAPDEYAGITIMHELIHALQDQYFNLDSMQHATGDDDRLAAAQSVMEGQATYEQMAIMLGGRGNIAAGLPGGWERMREMIREAQSSQPIFAAAPMAIQEELLFPYINGAEFVRRFKERRPSELPFQHLPSSSEQVMHETAFFGTPPDAPLRLTLPRIPNTVYENTMGEFETRLFLFQHSGDQRSAIQASVGWAGDRFAVVRTPAGNGIAWASAWDSGLDAAEFVDALGQAIRKRYKTPEPVISSGVRRYAGANRTVVITPTEIDGKNVVLVIDVPAGASANLVDIGRITIGS